MLPLDIVRLIAAHLRYRDVTHLAQTCRELYSLIQSDNDGIWKDQFLKTWWSNHGEPWSEVAPLDGPYREQLSQRLEHIRAIVQGEPVITLFLYSQKDPDTGMICGKTRYHKINLKRRSALLMGQIAAHNRLDRPFQLVIDLPDGRQESFYSTESKRYCRPLYHRIGIEYALQEFGQELHPLVDVDGKELPDERQARRIPYEAQIRFGRHIPQRNRQEAKRNRHIVIQDTLSSQRNFLRALQQQQQSSIEPHEPHRPKLDGHQSS